MELVNGCKNTKTLIAYNFLNSYSCIDSIQMLLSEHGLDMIIFSFICHGSEWEIKYYPVRGDIILFNSDGVIVGFMEHKNMVNMLNEIPHPMKWVKK